MTLALALAKKLQKKAKSNPKTFEAIVKKESDDPRAASGGSLGVWNTLGRMPEAFSNAVRKIKVVSSSKKTRILDVYKFATNPNVADDFFKNFVFDFSRVPMYDHQSGLISFFGRILGNEFFWQVVIKGG